MEKPDRVAAPTPETPSNPVGRINGAQTMSFTPVPDHPTPETPSLIEAVEQFIAAAESYRCASAPLADKFVILESEMMLARNRLRALLLAGAVSHHQPDPRTTNDDEVARVDGRGLSAGFGTAGSDAGAQDDSAETTNTGNA